MKHLLFCLLALAAVFGTTNRAEAKDQKDEESQHVIVTLKSGEQIDGYVHRGWHAENSMFKKENFSFKIKKTPEDKEPVEYTADDVVSIEYTEETENNPDGIRWESRPLARPNFSSRYNTIQRLVCVDKVGENATVYWWKVWAATGQNFSSRQLVTYFGVRFHNDAEGIVYPYSLVNSVLMDPKYPGLKDFCKNWFKGPEGKVHKKEAKENDAWILDMYDAYLAQQNTETTAE